MIAFTMIVGIGSCMPSAHAQGRLALGAAVGVGALCFKNVNACKAIAGGIASGLAGGAVGRLASPGRNLDTARGQANSGATITPPGFCKEDDFNSLNAAVNRVCKSVQLKACVPGESPIAVNVKAAAFKLCAQTRARREDACFRGGDAGHRQQISQMWSAYNRCMSLGA